MTTKPRDMFVMEEENIPEIDSDLPALLVDIDVDENDADKCVEDLEPAILEGGLLQTLSLIHI